MLSCVFNTADVSHGVPQHVGVAVTEDNVKAVTELPGGDVRVDGRTDGHVAPEQVRLLVCERADDQVPHVLHLDRHLLIVDGLAVTDFLSSGNKRTVVPQSFVNRTQSMA